MNYALRFRIDPARKSTTLQGVPKNKKSGRKADPKRDDLTMKQIKVIIEKHPDTYIAYPLGMRGVVVGQGDTYEAVLADIRSAIQFHIETFGLEQFETEPPILDAFIADMGIVL